VRSEGRERVSARALGDWLLPPTWRNRVLGWLPGSDGTWRALDAHISGHPKRPDPPGNARGVKRSAGSRKRANRCYAHKPRGLDRRRDGYHAAASCYSAARCICVGTASERQFLGGARARHERFRIPGGSQRFGVLDSSASGERKRDGASRPTGDQRRSPADTSRGLRSSSHWRRQRTTGSS